MLVVIQGLVNNEFNQTNFVDLCETYRYKPSLNHRNTLFFKVISFAIPFVMKVQLKFACS